ncbi:MAG: PQQ-dependent sugar dehydrogenase [Verrucomicrobia bacterium]|nr:PQQ-dependent sugar dehydrogenase [Verrucomicrobiota bacterium]
MFGDSPVARASVALKQFADGFTSPVVLLSLDDGSGRLVVVDQAGTAHVLGKDGQKAEQLFFDARSRLTKLNSGFDERGLLGLALHPKFKENRKVYFVYSAPLRDKSLALAKWDHTMTLSEFKVRENDRAQVDSASERVLLQIDKPWFNHNGGCVAFGPDGFLYLSVGDGGNADDIGRGHNSQIGNGQDTSTLLGKILRIDVDKGDPYAIPSDNPFADAEKGRPEIFAYGLRNSWRMSFDRGGNHELFAADVGQSMFEEVNIIVKGGNYGWNAREGFHAFNPKDAKHPPAETPKTAADGTPFVEPILEYKNMNGFPKDPEAMGVSVTGGYVYRGQALPELSGRYVFADWSHNFVLADGVVLVATRPANDAGKWSLERLKLSSPVGGKLGAYVVALGQDEEGELYVLTNGSNGLSGKSGKIFKIVPE